MTVTSEEVYDEHPPVDEYLEEAMAIPVKIAGESKEADAQLSSFSTWIAVANGGSQPVMIVPQDRQRHRCYIRVNGTAGDYVLIGKQGQVSNSQGARMYVGDTFISESESAIWLIPVAAITHDVVVTVIDERYYCE